MREIKFRGMSEGGWVYGDLYHAWSVKGIIPRIGWMQGNDSCNVGIMNPESIGQYTGLKDKNGREIYESDLIKDGSGCVWELFWNEKTVAFDMRVKGSYMSPWCPEELEVIGNVYENKELLEVK